MTDVNEQAESTSETVPPDSSAPETQPNNSVSPSTKEYGGPKGLEPTRYGDWEKSGRCIDF